MTRRRKLFLVGGAALLIAAARFFARTRVPDDYDSIGFVLALDDFDLTRFQPHFPGYPVYVALGRIAHLLIRSPLASAQLVSAAAAAATTIGLWRLGGASVVALFAGAWLPWMLGGAALSDGTAAAFGVLAFALLEFPATSGVLCALMLGTRVSYWPLAISWALLSRSRRGFAGATLGTAAWLIPLAWIVGPHRLWSLGQTHAYGHFTSWGGSIVTRPGVWLRTQAFARDLFFDGIAPQPVCLAILCALILLAAARARGMRAGLIVVIPYALWVFFAQNIVEQPRHLLPLVLALLLWLGKSLSARPLLASAAVATLFAASLPLAWQHARTLPAAAQAADWVLHQADPRPVLFGGRSMRFFPPPIITRERTRLAEVDVDLERMDPFPARVLVTSEVQVDRLRAARISDGPTFCRDARFDRQLPCLTLLQYRGAAP